jgi:hypothetical protein
VARTVVRAFLTVELQQIDPDLVDNRRDRNLIGVYEQSYGGHERRQQTRNGRCTLDGDVARAGFVEHKPYGIHAVLDGRFGILLAGNTANFNPGSHAAAL